VTLKGQGHDSNIFNARYFENGSSLEIETRLQWGTYRKWHVQYRIST